MSLPMRRPYSASATPALGQRNVNPHSTLPNAQGMNLVFSFDISIGILLWMIE
jgi:hypothetical protein